MDGATHASESVMQVSDPYYQVKGIGDFDGDGISDILWQDTSSGRPTSGWTLIWFMDGSTIASGEAVRLVGDPNWKVRGVGDFNGDGKADILWQDEGLGMDADLVHGRGRGLVRRGG